MRLELTILLLRVLLLPPVYRVKLGMHVRTLVCLKWNTHAMRDTTAWQEPSIHLSTPVLQEHTQTRRVSYHGLAVASVLQATLVVLALLLAHALPVPWAVTVHSAQQLAMTSPVPLELIPLMLT